MPKLFESRDEWRKSLERAVLSRFPDLLPEQINSPESRCHVDVPWHDFEQIEERLRSASLSISEAMHLGWVTLLRAYTASEDLIYRIEETCLGFQRSMPMTTTVDGQDDILHAARSLKILCAQSAILGSAGEDYKGLYQAHASQHDIILRFQGNGGQSGETQTQNPAPMQTEATLSLTVNTSQCSSAPFITYDAARVPNSVAQEMATTLHRIVSSMARQPHINVGHVALVDRHATVHLQPSIQSPRKDSLVEPICDMISHIDAAREAIWAPEGHMSYGHLIRTVDAVAHYLQRNCSVRQGLFVPILMNKGLFGVISMLAVQKSGAAFCPIDPQYPHFRIKEILSELGASVVLTTEQTALQRQKSLEQVQRVVVVDELIAGLDLTLEVDLKESSWQRTAYCFMTSGSTGKPKGVVMGQQAMTRSIMAHSQFFGITSQSRVLQNTPYVFDPCLTEIFGALVNGACLYVPDDETRLTRLAEFVASHGINWTFFTPSFASMLEAKGFPGLKTVVLGGEPVSEDCAQSWKLVGRRLVNGYGPTEACCFCCAREIPADTKSPANIGKPLREDCIAVLVDPDDHDKLVPTGAVGECKERMLIGGPILADGYLGDSERTAASFFTTSTITGDGPRRFYKTGDLCRQDVNRDLHYLGRRDTQVKIRGQRVELAEVEHVLRRSATAAGDVDADDSLYFLIADVVNTGSSVILTVFFAARHAANQQRQRQNVLEATCADQDAPHIMALRKSALASLPRHMVPQLFVQVSFLPTSSSGKIDKQSLHRLVPPIINRTIRSDSLADDTPGDTGPSQAHPSYEIALQKAWSRALGISEGNGNGLNIHAQSFTDSIAALRAVQELRKLGLEIPLKAVFGSPTIAAMAAHVTPARMEHWYSKTAATPPDRFRLLDPHLHQPSICAEAAVQCRVSTDVIQDIYPCTPFQSSILALSATDPQSYTASYRFTLPPDTDSERLKQAIAHVIAANPIMRTRIVLLEDGESYQVVLVNEENYLRKSDTGGSEETAGAVGGYGSPLHKISLLIDERKSHNSLVWLLHHAVYDGFCLPFLLEDVSKCYAGLAPRVRPPFTTFVRYLHGIDSERTRCFWKDYLEGFNSDVFPPPPKTSSHTRTTRRSSKSALYTFDCPLPIKTPGITISTLLKGSWAVAISLYTSSQDVVFGNTMNGRDVDLPDIENLLGPTLGTVPVRATFERSTDVGGYLSSLQDAVLDISYHAHVGLPAIRKCSASAAEACKFGTLFVAQPPWLATDGAKGHLLGVDSLESEQEESADYGILVSAVLPGDKATTCVLRATFDASNVDGYVVERLLRLTSVAACELASSRSDTLLSQLNLVPAEDLAQMQAWNMETVLKPLPTTLHSLIDVHSVSRNQCEAVCSTQGSLTYGELGAASDGFASSLRQLGIGPGCIVPICFEKSIWTVCAMLAVLKSGAAFIPMDMDHPRARLEEIVTQSQSSTILTSPGTAHMWPKYTTLIVSQSTAERLTTTVQPTYGATSPDSLAYVLFTSGSTGKPKGVMIEHKAIVTASQGMTAAFGVGPNTRTLQFSSYAWDASIFEIFTTLIAGGVVCVADEYERLNDLPATCASLQINLTLITPTFAKTMTPFQVPSIKTLIVGGEFADSALIATWGRSVRLINCYGPAECSVVCTTQWLQSEEHTGVIGKPTVGQVWLVQPDDHHRPVPLGVVGELIIGGATLARGYLLDAEKTTSSFVDAPNWMRQAAPAPGLFAKVYKTGDLAKFDQNGFLTFVGRKDTQVKVRGQRLEIGEIEAHLTHESIALSCVVFPASGPFAKTLVAFVAMDPASSSSPALSAAGEHQEVRKQLPILLRNETDLSHFRNTIQTVRQHMTEILPDYMIPRFFIPVSHLPRSASYKVDRKRIGTWVEAFDSADADFVFTFNQNSQVAKAMIDASPSTEVERCLQTVWSQVLNVPKESIGVNVPFIIAGGDSITAMQVVSRCRSTGIQFSVKDLLTAKTIAELVKRVSAMQFNPRTPPTDRAFKSSDREPFELSPIQKLYFDLAPSAAHHLNQSFLLRISKSIPLSTLVSAMTTIVYRHPMLRARFVKDDSTDLLVQYTIAEVDSCISIAHHQGQHPDPNHLANIFAGSQSGMDTAAGPLLRADLIETSVPGEQLLFLVANHLVIDLVSWRILLNDLETLLRGQNLPGLRSDSFHAWTVRQAERARRYVTIGYKQVIPALDVPLSDFDYWGVQPSENLHQDIERETFELDQASTSRLLHKPDVAIRSEPIDILIAGLIMSFAQVFVDRNVPAVYNEGHGREPWDDSMDVSETVGWFTTFCPVMIEGPSVTAGLDYIEAVRLVKDYRFRTPGKGRDYFALRHHTNVFDAHGSPEITLNFGGQFQQLERSGSLFERVPTERGDMDDMSGNMRRFGLLEISADVTDGHLAVSVTYNHRMRYINRIHAWMSAYRQWLVKCSAALAEAAWKPTLADFPLMSGFSSRELEAIIHEYSLDLTPLELFPMSPLQDYMLQCQYRDPALYTPVLVFRLPSTAKHSTEELRSAWQAVVRQCPVLRTVFLYTARGCHQAVLKWLEPDISISNVACWKAEELLKMPVHPWSPKLNAHRLSIHPCLDGTTFLRFHISHALTDLVAMDVMMDMFRRNLDQDDSYQPVSSYSSLLSHMLDLSQPAADVAFWDAYGKDHAGTFVGPGGADAKHATLREPLRAIKIALDDGPAIRRFCHESGSTFSSLVRWAWATALAVALRQQEVMFGLVVSLRHYPINNIDRILGPCIGFMPCRVKVESHTCSPLAADALRLQEIAAIQDDMVSGLKYHAELDPKRDCNLFDTIVNVRRRPQTSPTGEHDGLMKTVEAQDPFDFAVVLEIDEDADGSGDVVCSFWPDRVREDTVQLLADVFRKAVMEVCGQ